MTAAPDERVRRLSLREHSRLTVPPPPLERAAVDALRHCDAVTVTGHGRQIELRSKSLVGVIRAGPVELRINPKLTIRRLLWLLDHARNPKGWRDDDIVGLTEVGPEDTVTAVAVSFLAATRRALAAGLLQGYRTIEQTDMVLRGRLREADQFRARPGIPLPVETRYDDYTVDIPENQLLLAATLTLLGAPCLPAATARGLRQLRADLDEVTPQPADVLRNLPIRDDPLTRRYSPALRLAHIVLAGRGLDQPAGTVAAAGFLFNLDNIFENWLRAVLDNALKRHGTGPLSYQHKMSLDKAGSIEVRPDLVWFHHGKPAAVIDAKYIQFTPAGRTPEYFQVLAYCLVLGLPAGYIVYAAGDRDAIRHEVRSAGVTLHVWPLNLDASTPDILADIDALAAHIAAHANAATRP
jgi:5-methylcytosine-specific restriction enzyme subunit McrC